MRTDRQRIDYVGQLADFFHRQPSKNVPPGELIATPEDQPHSVIFVQSGFVKIFFTSRQGKELIVTYLNPSNHCGNVIFNSTENFSKYSVEALTPVVIRRALRVDFMKFIDEHPQICQGMALCLASLIKDLLEQIESLKNGSSYQRLIACLYYLGRELGHDGDSGRIIDCRLTHRMLASLTGLTRETVTLQLRKLKNNGLIEYSHHAYLIPDMKKLQAETVYQD